MRTLWDEPAVVREIQRLSRQIRIDRVECLWEPGMLLAARLREALGLPGMSVEQTLPFRDKEVMKRRLDDAGVRTPRHASATTEDQVREAAERIGYPVIVKPIAGAGSADTHRCDSRAELEQVLRRVKHVEEVSVEEFVEAEEFTFDTICAGGRLAFENVCLYKPRPLVQRQRRVGEPAVVRAPEPRPARARRGTPHGPAGARRARLRHRLHPHGVVPQVRPGKWFSARSAGALPARAWST